MCIMDMDKEKILGYVEIVGETLVVAGAAAWLPLPVGSRKTPHRQTGSVIGSRK
jgi:hypothetical protein